ncbi:putative MFS family arabinose efflux permease [Diaminobutyricimonas aerilata]|uniref:Putative MFS family arabinose efflux permease n=1 Tax=Diaminobutyricimonas aerilata TaxID=1162967 RepID=A0A2M9CMH4_9MICO|nr:MFS transporter [Diaminobutyricimonas aerilata]PJJ73102.1 putative MFS family arabinose efflux permease [Diaminobutyricimonas aerilata]
MSAVSVSTFPLFRLLVLTGAIFVSVSSEFLPTGLLPDMARDLDVSESKVGLLVTIFAGTVVVSTAPLTIITQRLSRKWLMVLLLAVFALGNVLAALAPTYELLVVARVIGGLAHGLFWAVTGPYAAHLVPRHQLARAVAVTNSGGTIAFVLGVPLGTALGHALGWRLAFLVMGAVVVVFMLLVIAFLPPVQHLHQPATGEITLPGRKDPTVPAVIIVCVSVLFIMTGQNVFYTYIAPWLIREGGFPEDAVSGLLFVYGAAGAVGLVLAGALGDRYPRATAYGLIAGVTVAVATLSLGAGSPGVVIAGLVAWSIAFGGLPSLFHARMLHSASPRIRDVASAWITTSFNIAIGGGAILGGSLLDAAGIDVLPWTLIGLVAAGLLFVALSDGARLRAQYHHVRRDGSA